MHYSVPHPFDLEIQDFGSYSLILDLRRQDEWLAGNVPGSVCRPAITPDEELTIERLIRRGDYVDIDAVKKRMVYQQVNAAIESTKQLCGVGHILVYCARGGYRSQYVSEAMRKHGLKVDVLRGGWLAYRQWAQSALDTYFMMFDWRPLSSLPHADEYGDDDPQVLDIDAFVASPRIQLFMDVDGRIPKSVFESELLELLRLFDRERPVYFSPISLTTQLPIQLPSGLLRVLRQMQMQLQHQH